MTELIQSALAKDLNYVFSIAAGTMQQPFGSKRRFVTEQISLAKVSGEDHANADGDFRLAISHLTPFEPALGQERTSGRR